MCNEESLQVESGEIHSARWVAIRLQLSSERATPERERIIMTSFIAAPALIDFAPSNISSWEFSSRFFIHYFML